MITAHKQIAVLRFATKKDIALFKDTLRMALAETEHVSTTHREERLLLRSILASFEGIK